MKHTSKFLTLILISGLIYSIYCLYTGHGGSGLYDAIDVLGYSSIILFISSLMILCFNIRHPSKQMGTIIFMFIGLPMTFMWILGTIENIHYNREPDLLPKYPVPVSKEQFVKDSINIKTALDSLVAFRNEHGNGPTILYALIDTIIYSQKGDKVFVSYMTKFEQNELGADIYPWFLFSDKRNSLGWQLVQANKNLGGNYHDLPSLKKEVRKFYFNQFSFLDEDSTSKDYFWRIIMHPGG